MEKCILHLGEVLPEGCYNRVHAVLVTCDGRVLIRYKNGDPRITGGRIDDSDGSLLDALRREVLEEINCEIDRCDYLGYLAVNKRNYYNDIGISIQDDYNIENDMYWARMVARISKVGAPQPDPDRENNWIYGRELVPRQVAAKKLAASAPLGNTTELVSAAWELAQKNDYFTEEISEKTEILNLETMGGEIIKKLL